jgi:hypothetical protein
MDSMPGMPSHPDGDKLSLICHGVEKATGRSNVGRDDVDVSDRLVRKGLPIAENHIRHIGVVQSIEERGDEAAVRGLGVG